MGKGGFGKGRFGERQIWERAVLGRADLGRADLGRAPRRGHSPGRFDEQQVSGSVPGLSPKAAPGSRSLHRGMSRTRWGQAGGGLAESSTSEPTRNDFFWFKPPCSPAAVTQLLPKHGFNLGTLAFHGFGFPLLVLTRARLTKSSSPLLSVTEDTSCAVFMVHLMNIFNEYLV